MFENIYQTNGALKFNETLVVTLKKITMDDMIEFFTAYFNSILIFHGNLFAVEMRKESVTLNKLCYAGFCLLELTKIHMYDFYYNNLKKKYGDRAKLQFTDTDTLLLNIEKAKGVVKSGVVKKEITHPNNVDTLFNNEIMKHKNTSIQSKGHELYTEDVNKKNLFAPLMTRDTY